MADEHAAHPPDELPDEQPAGAINPLEAQRLRTRPRRPLTADDYLEGLEAGDRAILGRAITLVESEAPGDRRLAAELLDLCARRTPESCRVGITGVPGVGKSTFIDVLGRTLTARDHRVAVLAIDPSSTRTRGSILGDKTRMEGLAADPHAFIRPSPTGGSLGGVARSTREAILLCETAGFDVVLVETVGVGQSEIAVHGMVDFFLLLALTGAGDELQGIKRGIIEVADAIAITKADGDNEQKAQRARVQYGNALKLYPPDPSGWRPRVHTCSALDGRGIDRIWETIREHQAHARATGAFERRRRDQARQWMHEAIERHLRTRFFDHPAVRAALPEVEAAVLEGKMSSAGAVRTLLDAYEGGS